ncbi:hypothetical protein [uncultured Megasphaera sp.]|uniref:hypothetical protein n=1 Tax=uncultured Megasphaera sp. TaxID=165188 RepID=UPI0026598A35|nr:hypothetical protein [uncultured Megasphaera sp.]
MNDVIKRLQKEADEAKQLYMTEICRLVAAHLEVCPQDADHVTMDKTLNGCFKFLQERARKNQVNGCGVCNDRDVYEYFGFAGDITPSSPVMAGTTVGVASKPQAMADFSIDDLFD